MASLIARRLPLLAASSARAFSSKAAGARALGASEAPKKPEEPSKGGLAKLISEKTGNTGALLLASGLAAVGISKEIIILHHETIMVGSFGLAAYFIYKNIKQPVAEMLDQDYQASVNSLQQFRDVQREKLAKDRKAAEQYLNTTDLVQDLRGFLNNLNEVDAEVRAREQYANVAAELKKSLDLAVSVVQAARRQEQLDLADALEQSLLNQGLSKEDDAAYLKKCLSDLAALAPK
ncbi:hypothetical protein CAOG_09009 [Capsaspora owczarzaki ATCC 30864]|uniref:ATP synthase subunit b n=1 Tax=Capsaspora owczarzaki (strain ATCC 30864) TaxID=595528 RepID=A0A0D2WV22_CAPO3|nr:hypothetical protein CAOG_09009 [Capsaspora owczarzaki ATCC 30864]KJE96570.1 hypothetical protein CAOG_009009 [Capsaspora owczarzaki ATCC 30864]|eukprot:XP_011270696.1 hypothetical protein CAOG_09009 [Capsaspora owczarzaki ATCC 30864]